VHSRGVLLGEPADQQPEKRIEVGHQCNLTALRLARQTGASREAGEGNGRSIPFAVLPQSSESRGALTLRLAIR
jgi:hypothetical protein